MKKILVLAAAAALFAVPAFSVGITGTAHDLSSGTANAISGDSTEICVYCHTPHGAGAAGTAPLWNRTTVNATDVYGNPAGTMQAVPTLVAVNATDAVLCLSCHDGSSLTGALTNPPNSTGQPAITGTMSTTANLDTDLSNDHPVGFAYTTALATSDTELVDPASSTAIELYGTGSNMMWCSSCHDVHDDTNGEFLLISNAGSNLCLTCHIK